MNEILSEIIYKAPEREEIKIPTYILDGIKYELRDYQQEAIKNFIYYMNKKKFYQERYPDLRGELPFNRNKNHLLFNVATGGGKTLLMATIILYMYNEFGYKNFLFLSPRLSINDKTYNNFLRKDSGKYLFAENINIVESNNFNFEENDSINISIKTYKYLNEILNTVRENAFSLEDIKNKKIVILADESHHLNANYDNEGGTFEYDVSRVLNTKLDDEYCKDGNFLFEFTATIDWRNDRLLKKYSNKCIYKYDLENFYKSGYTKTIDLLRRDVDNNENLMFGAIILNKYREVLFNEMGNNIKPVIMFKSNRKFDSIMNNTLFNNIIEGLNENILEDLNKKFNENKESIITKAFNYLIEKYDYDGLVNIIKADFCKNNIFNTNFNEASEDKIIEKNARLLNTLEEQNNNIRVIFSVDKLNEGWDVLNLFDIVKLYTTQSETETTQEMQLLGRGARYCPFDYKNENRYRRKLNNDEKFGILEQLYFHSRQSNETIKNLKERLEKNGISFNSDKKRVIMKIKENLQGEMLKKEIFVNSKKEKNLLNIFEYLNNKRFSFQMEINSNGERQIKVFQEEINENDNLVKYIKLTDVDYHIKLDAVVNNSKYNFEKIYEKMNINSFEEFIKKLDALENIEIVVKNWDNSNESKYNVYYKFLDELYEKFIGKTLREFVGTKEFNAKKFFEIFENDGKIVKEIEEGKTEYDSNNNYFVYDKCILTGEEKDFIIFFESNIYKELEKQCFEIYLLRNERKIKLYQFDNGVGFEPDFVLFLKKGNLKYQIYIEPKGEHIIDKLTEVNKARFLEQINKFIEDGEIKLKNNINSSVMDAEIGGYRLVGLPLYNSGKKEEFKKKVEEFVLNDD